MDDKEKLSLLIKNSSLEEKDKADWEKMISVSQDNFIESLLEILEEFPQELGWFNEIYKRKRQAFTILKENKAEGEALLKNIYQEEKEKLETLLSS